MRHFASIVLVLAAVGTSARAQGLPSVETITVDMGPYFQPGTPVRISGTALRRVGGYVLAVNADTILLGANRGAAPSSARQIQLSAVDTLWTRGRWFWQSMAVASSLGGTIGGAVCVFGQKENCYGLPIGFFAGAALGAIVGKARPVWQRRFVRRDGGPVPTIGPWMGR